MLAAKIRPPPSLARAHFILLSVPASITSLCRATSKGITIKKKKNQPNILSDNRDLQEKILLFEEQEKLLLEFI